MNLSMKSKAILVMMIKMLLQDVSLNGKLIIGINFLNALIVQNLLLLIINGNKYININKSIFIIIITYHNLYT